ncbi:hypothetical protein QBZ16_001519 [Prototheca wickerhamii]|uniref:Syndetin C-terminal domain-containing protein n=1 Tax=Prototheca wickerhamii TaxID=3111 RepID=A0AAD9IE57_PROWI|nr:hypothetical protein QBZ16_001519 [Prototheca wickerhamii]
MTSPLSPQKRLLGRLGVPWLGRPSSPGREGQGPSGSPGADAPPASPPSAVKRKLTAGEGLDSVSSAYQEDGADTLDLELRALPLSFTPAEVESVADARTAVLEAVSERLSEHVLRNYHRFVDGVRGVTAVQGDVEAAHTAARLSREVAGARAGHGRRRAARAARAAAADGDYAEAAALRRRCAATLARRVPAGLDVRRALERSLEEAGAALRLNLSEALGALCLDFARSRTAAARDPAATLPDLVRALPADQFRAALARALQVLFEELASHRRMALWHGAELDAHAARLAELQRQVAELVVEEEEEREKESGIKTTYADGEVSVAVQAAKQQKSAHQRPLAACPPLPSTTNSSTTAAASRSAAEELRATMRAEAAYGAALRAVRDALVAGRSLVWEEVARRLSALLASPAAFEGEHFLQVIDWVQRFVRVGEAFSGVESATLRALLQRQSANFFAAFHASNVESLDSMLGKEAWTRLPVSLPGLLDALRGGGEAVGAAGAALPAGVAGPAVTLPASASLFDAIVAQGNPWLRGGLDGGVTLDAGRRGARAPRLGFEGGGGGVEATGAASTEGEGAGNRPDSPEDHASSSDSDSDLHGDYIDEDQQRVLRRGAGDRGAHSLTLGSPTKTQQHAAVTNSSWRTMKRMRDYAGLMCALRPAAPAIFAGLAELHDLYALHVAACFDPEGLRRVARGAPARGARRGASARAVVREAPGSPVAAALAEAGVSGAAGWWHGGAAGSATPQTDPLLRSSASQPLPLSGSFSRPAASPEATSLPLHQAGLVSSGNMYGLVERLVAAESLREIGRRIAEARAPLRSLLDAGESQAVETFLAKTPGAVEELLERVMHLGVGLLLNLQWLPEAIGATSYALAEPPTEPQAWTGQLLRQLKGAARIKASSLEGRAALTLDVQTVEHGLRQLAPRELRVSLATVDAYVKAFYIPLAELGSWAQLHPEYSKEQMLALATCMAESSGLRRKERTAMLALLEASLSEH